MKKVLIVLALLIVAYGAGFWGEYRKRTAAESELARQQAQLTEAQDRVRSGELLGQILNLKDAAVARNYGHAQELSTKLFDATLAESGRVSRSGSLSPALEAVLGLRDAVTAALTRSDPASVDVIQQAEARLRQGLGYPVAPRPSPVPSPSASPSSTAAPTV